MKTLYMIGGTMGVGKTAVCQQLKKLLPDLEQDIARGIRTEDIVERSMRRLPLYQHLDTIKVDTSDKTVLETAQEIMEISKKYGPVMGRV